MAERGLQLLVRPAREADIPALCRLGAAMVAESPVLRPWPFDLDEFVPKVRALIEGGGAFVAEDGGGVIVGALLGLLSTVHLASKVPAVLEVGFYVAPAWRERGVADELVAALERWGTRSGAVLAAIGSSTHVHPQAVARLAERRGYRAAGSSYALLLEPHNCEKDPG